MAINFEKSPMSKHIREVVIDTLGNVNHTSETWDMYHAHSYTHTYVETWELLDLNQSKAIQYNKPCRLMAC